MPKYVCANDDDFASTSDATAMEHLENNPDHKLVRIDRDAYTGNVETMLIDIHSSDVK